MEYPDDNFGLGLPDRRRRPWIRVRHHACRLRPRTRTFSRRPIFRRSRREFLDRIRPRDRRIHRPLRHVLESRLVAARRLREILGRRRRLERARSRKNRPRHGGRTRGLVPSQTALPKSHHRPWRARRQFHPGRRHFDRPVDDLWAARHVAADRCGQGRDARGRSRVSSRRHGAQHQRRAHQRVSTKSSRTVTRRRRARA